MTTAHKDQGARRLRTAIRLAVGTLLLGVLVAALAVGPGWLKAWSSTQEMRPRVRTFMLVSLTAGRWLHIACWLSLPAATIALLATSMARRRRGQPAGRAGRLALLAGSLLLGLITLESAAAFAVAQSRWPPLLPTSFPESKGPDELSLAVIGESSAMGLPYDPWVSTGQILASLLEQQLPGRRVRVDMQAHGGICLEQAILALRELKRQPDILLIYAGHNEFQARFGWSRSVRYYVDERPQRLRTVLESWWLKTSPIATVVNEAIDRQRLDEPPPPNARRELVDHPAFRREEHDYLLDDFERRLRDVVRYAKRLRAIPIIIAPPGNEVDFPPFRSCLSPQADAAERARFARLMEQGRRLEGADPSAAYSHYRKLVDAHPEFAELHYRIGVLALKKNDLTAARAAFRRARDLDAMPMRCPADFQSAIARVAREEDAVFVDGPAVLATLNDEHLLDGRLFHDPQHPNLYSYTALACRALDLLAERPGLGLRPAATTWLSRLDGVYPQVVSNFGIDDGRWAEICRKTAILFTRISQISRQPLLYLRQAGRLMNAADAIRAGAPPESTGILGVGRRPPSRRAAEAAQREGEGAQDQSEPATARDASAASERSQ